MLSAERMSRIVDKVMRIIHHEQGIFYTTPCVHTVFSSAFGRCPALCQTVWTVGHCVCSLFGRWENACVLATFIVADGFELRLPVDLRLYDDHRCKQPGLLTGLSSNAARFLYVFSAIANRIKTAEDDPPTQRSQT